MWGGGVLLFAVVSFANGDAASAVQPVMDVLTRVLGTAVAARFDLTLHGASLCSNGAPDCFTLADADTDADADAEGNGKTVHIVGSTLSALSAGAGVYLKRYCNASLTWAKTGGLLGGVATAAAGVPLPRVGRPASAPLLIAKVSKWTYYMNVVCLSLLARQSPRPRLSDSLSPSFPSAPPPAALSPAAGRLLLLLRMVGLEPLAAGA